MEINTEHIKSFVSSSTGNMQWYNAIYQLIQEANECYHQENVGEYYIILCELFDMTNYIKCHHTKEWYIMCLDVKLLQWLDYFQRDIDYLQEMKIKQISFS